MTGAIEKGKSAGRKEKKTGRKKQRDGKTRKAEKTQDVEETQEAPTDRIGCPDHAGQGHQTREILHRSGIVLLRDNF